MPRPSRLIAATLVLALAAACHAAPATLARTHPALMTVQAIEPARWVDRAAGVVEVAVECRPTTVEVWCRDHGRTTCETRRILAEATGCQGDIVDLVTAGGVSARATVTPAGVATFTIDPGADLAVIVPARPVPVPPPPRLPQRSYRGLIVGADVGLLITASLAILAFGEGRVGTISSLCLAAYLAAGPLIHHHHGNSDAGWSLVRRAAYPALGLAAGLVVAIATSMSCGESGDCGDRPDLILIGGGALGMLLASAHDVRDAHVDVGPARVTPVISSDGERTTVGLTGRF